MVSSSFLVYVFNLIVEPVGLILNVVYWNFLEWWLFRVTFLPADNIISFLSFYTLHPVMNCHPNNTDFYFILNFPQFSLCPVAILILLMGVAQFSESYSI